MSEKSRAYQLIDDYLNNRLNKSEIELVEKRLHNDVNFKRYFDVQKTANRLIILSEEERIKKELNVLHYKSIRRKQSVTYVLLLLLFVAVIGAFFWDSEFLSKEGNQSSLYNDQNNKELLKPDIIEQKNTDSSLYVEKQVGNEVVSGHIKDDLNPIEEPSIELDTALNDSLSIYSKNNAEIINTNIAGDSLIVNEVTESVQLDSTEEIFTSKKECLSYYADVKISSIATCKGKANGKIIIEEYTSNYKYIINGGTTLHSDKKISNLYSGNYHLIAVNDKNCKSDPIMVEVQAFDCDFVIQPERFVNWEIGLQDFEENNVELTIYNARSGQRVLKKRLDISENNSWNGTDENGNLLPMGSYVYVLSASNNQRKGNITIVR